jgi:hypothetical protein
MTRWLLLATLCGMADVAQAHFVFVVPQADGAKAKVVLSEDLSPDADVDLILKDNAKLYVRDESGKDAPLVLRKTADDSAETELPGHGLRVVHGIADLGVMQRGNTKPFLLVYHPKTILGDAFDPQASLGEKSPVEIIPIGKAGAVAFRVVAQGKPVANAEVNVVLPDGERTKTTTDASGQTATFPHTGRFAAWTRHFEAKGGESGGRPFEETRHYATLVIDVGVAK